VRITKQYTNRESQSLDKYLQEIGRVELLDPESEIELAQNIKKGGFDFYTCIRAFSES
jgi:RNA polymerase primary sigma factor